MKNYEDKIYSLGETVTGQTQAMSQAVQKTLEMCIRDRETTQSTTLWLLCSLFN